MTSFRTSIQFPLTTIADATVHIWVPPPILFFCNLEIDVIGELLVISGLLVNEMKKTENQQLVAQEVYNLELKKLQSEKAAKVKTNLGQRNRFQDLLRERVDKNPLSAPPNQV